MLNKDEKEDKKINRYMSKAKNVVLILGVCYLMFTILAISSYVNTLNKVSDTKVTFGNVLASVWWQILMIILFAITYVLYIKKPKLGVILEILMGISMLVYIIVSIISMGFNFLAFVIELIYPTLLIIHGTFSLKKLKNASK